MIIIIHIHFIKCDYLNNLMDIDKFSIKIILVKKHQKLKNGNDLCYPKICSSFFRKYFPKKFINIGIGLIKFFNLPAGFKISTWKTYWSKHAIYTLLTLVNSRNTFYPKTICLEFQHCANYLVLSLTDNIISR